MAVSTAYLENLTGTTSVLSTSVSGASVVKNAALAAPSTQISQNFRKLHPKALSTLLILTGLMQISLGAMMMKAENGFPSLAVRSGAYIWGGLMVFVAGCITVATETKDSITLIKTCLGSHVANAVLGGVALAIYIIQLDTETQACWVPVDKQNFNKCISLSNSQEYSRYDYYDYEERYSQNASKLTLILRISVISVILILSVLGLIISVCIMVFGWKVLKTAGYSLLK
ncbi:membrane-spanning 4-domains subfamily A member 15-like [Pelobates cultripes]|uniref:Membrane-spanning 4-domains subfamily A member 15-like n=1 Tax=Pelobates cultripes TaxID=61616 RepID=A0AAD1T9A7_PELCU|nr:membrane-spanning 4-domains subfamily A member 15-like [Pelobates cultripes]